MTREGITSGGVEGDLDGAGGAHANGPDIPGLPADGGQTEGPAHWVTRQVHEPPRRRRRSTRDQAMEIACFVQVSTQAPQSMHSSLFTSALFSTMVIELLGQASTQSLQPSHFSLST